MPLGFLCTNGSRDEIVPNVHTRVELLDDSTLDLILSKDTTGFGCLERIGAHLGLTETAYFGLQYRKKGSEWWLDLDKSVARQLCYHGKPNEDVTLLFRVKYFVSSVYSLQEEITRYLYYLQLKKNVLSGQLHCEEQGAVVLASYMTQAEFGDYDEDRHSNYVKDYFLLPCTLVPEHSQDELDKQIKDLHKSYSGLSAQEAELEFIRLSQQLEGYGDEYYPAKDKEGYTLLIGATFIGIAVRHPHGPAPVYFKWPDIVRITHSKKYFCIESIKSMNTIQFEMENKAMAKYVWKMFVGHHRFRRMNVTRTPREFERTRAPKSMNTNRRLTLQRVNPLEDSVDDSSSEAAVVHDDVDGISAPGGIINPVFDDDGVDGDIDLNSSEEDLTHSVTSIQTAPIIHRTYSNTRDTPPRPLSSCIPERCANSSIGVLQDRPVSVDLSSVEIRERSMDRGPVATRNGPHSTIGSSLSVDSGHPPGSMEFSNVGISLDSLVEVDNQNNMLERTPDSMDSAIAFAGTTPNGTTEFSRPVRPQSLNLGFLEGTEDDSSVVTGRTSGYSTSTDSDYSEEPWGRHEVDIKEASLTREQQLAYLEKVLTEGQVFTEFQKTSRKSENLAVNTGQLAANVNKNKYPDVLPYEETRVCLNPRNNGSNSDYINANHIKMKVGYMVYRYIAAQGPTDDTLTDFWQMIWEQNVRVVVMATEEKSSPESNCKCYWPDAVGKAEDYGHIRVVIEDIQDSSPYKTRRLKVRHVPSKQDRTIYHVQFTDWPDHKVPEDPTNFLEFLDQMESLRQRTCNSLPAGEERPPVLVHCTAGVGRTGVIILTDLMIACIQNNKRINIHRTLIRLRRQRMLLVANFGQYRFVYTTVVHYIKNSRLI